MASAAEHSWSFWTAPIGSAIVTFALGFPASCKGPGDFVGHVGRQGLDEQCDNVLGFAAVIPSEAAATVVALVVGALFFGIASLFESRNRAT